jgi:uncharacterized protein YecE (DUF72 family)
VREPKYPESFEGLPHSGCRISRHRKSGGEPPHSKFDLVSVSLSAMARRTKLESIHPTLFDLQSPEPVAALTTKPEVNSPYDSPGLLLGTSAFTAAGWPGSFYPEGMKSSEYLRYYATKFKSVEIDSSYYGPPSPSTVTGWRDKTPPNFVFSAKVPQIITHEKMLVDCDAELNQFLETMNLLGPKLGPLVLQFPFFDRWRIPDQRHFLSVLGPFLKKLPAHYKFALEIRNRNWLDAKLTELLRQRNVALVLQDLSSMPRPWEYPGKLDFVTADFVYVRWLGNRKGIEEQTKTWDRMILDRRSNLINWVELFRQLVSRNLKIFAYANNHYAGNGPGTVKLFWELYNQK